MEINNCLELFSLNHNYTLKDLQNNYNKVILKLHKDNNKDNKIYDKFKNCYNILLCNLDLINKKEYNLIPNHYQNSNFVKQQDLQKGKKEKNTCTLYASLHNFIII